MTPSPFTAGNAGTSKGGIIDLPTPKRAANVYVGRKAAVPTAADLSALEMTSDGELPALLGDLNLDEALDPGLFPLDEAGGPPTVLGLDLSDLPAPVGPRPRSPLSTRGAAASAGSAPRSMLPAGPRGPSSKPGFPSEPEPLPAPPTRDPQVLLGETLPPAVAGKRVSRPDLARLPLGEHAVAPPPAERVTVPSAAFPPAARETQPTLRRTSPSGSLGITKPVHSLFDASEPAPPAAAPRPTETTPPLLPLPALPSDESGGKGPAATSASNSAGNSASGSISESSGQSFITGGPGTSSTATSEPKPLRLGYLLIALAVLALLLALMVFRIAGTWKQQPGAGSEPPPANSPADPGPRPSP